MQHECEMADLRQTDYNFGKNYLPLLCDFNIYGHIQINDHFC